MLTRSRIKLWSVGGGKGGIGKSVFTLGLGISLARMGKKVILIDGDLGGANLHTILGVRYPPVTLDHFLLKKVARLEDTVIDTQLEGVGLICGADDVLGAANPTYAQKVRLLNQMEALPADYILLDLGAGTSFNILDLFNHSLGKIAVCTGQATSLQNVYGFIKTALFRKLSRELEKDDDILWLLYQMSQQGGNGIQSIPELLTQLETSDPDKAAYLNKKLEDFRLFLVVNMVKSRQDQQSAEIIQTVCRNYLSIKPQILGYVTYDQGVDTAISQMTPFYAQARSKALSGLHEIALRFLIVSRVN